MEKETKVLLWGLFSMAVLTAGFVPVAWNTTEQAADQGVVANANLAQALWGQSSTVPASIEASTQYPQTTSVAIIPGATDPQITSLQWDTSSFPPQLTIHGSGFGNPPNAGQDVLTIRDDSRGWMANNTTSGVVAHVASWTNHQIVVDGLSGYGGGDSTDLADGLGSFVFAPGDQIYVSVTNPQTGNRGTGNTPYPADAPMPVVTMMSSSATIQAGQSVELTGNVTFDGQPLIHQAVTLRANGGGVFRAQGGTQGTASDFMIVTDATGHFSATWTAPDMAGDVGLSAMADSITASTTEHVITPPVIQSVTWNTSTWPPQVTMVGQYFGSNWQPGDLNVLDITRQWGVGAVQYTLSPTSGDGQVVITDMNQYGGGDGQWLFAPGDAVQVWIRNPQTGLSSTLDTTYPADAPMPSLLLRSLDPVAAGQTQTLSGQVEFAGVGLANQEVTLGATGGGISSGSSAVNGQAVITDASGGFDVTYAAPSQTGVYTLSAHADSRQTQQTVQVVPPTVTLDPLPTLGAGQTVTMTGQVTGVGGAGLANHVVSFTASQGNIASQTVTTDASGHFKTAYTASGTGGTETITAVCNGGTGVVSASVRGFVVTLSAAGDQTDNQVTLTANVNEPLNGYTLSIVDQTTGHTIAQTTQGTSLRTQITQQQDETDTYIAEVQ